MTSKVLKKQVKALCFLALLLVSGCQSINQLRVSNTIKKSEVLSGHFTGFCLFDPVENKYLNLKDEQLNFNPASNMKILTTLVCLETFGDSLPSFAYREVGDSLIVQPFGDPTFLNPIFRDQPAYAFLKQKSNLFIRNIDAPLKEFGPGWAWDDFQYDFQPERSWFPIYGNMVRVLKERDSLQVIPAFFNDYLQVNYGAKPGDYISRDIKYNLFNVWIENNNTSFEREIPFDYDEELLIRLLQDTLDVVVNKTNRSIDLDKIFYNQPALRVISYMMLASDNFLSEQLLIQAALSQGYVDIDLFRNLKLKEWSSFNLNHIEWHDGSGLSRYNLISPLSLVKILNKIYEMEDWNTIKTIFPAGGQSGTLKNWYASESPFVYAKTGTLSNNHNLSGYLVADSGKILIFSLMNNNYIVPTEAVKKEMDILLRKVRKIY